MCVSFREIYVIKTILQKYDDILIIMTILAPLNLDIVKRSFLP